MAEDIKKKKSNLGWYALGAVTLVGVAYVATRKPTAPDTAKLDQHIASTIAHGATGATVGTTNQQILQNKSHSGLFNIINGTDADLTGGLNNGVGGYLVSGTPTGLNVAIDDNEIMARNNGASSPLFLQAQGGSVHLGGPLYLPGGPDITATSGGPLVLGSTTGQNLTFDNNEIMSRNNGVPAILNLNNEGGPIYLGGPLSQRLNIVNGNTILTDIHNTVFVNNNVPVFIYVPNAQRHFNYEYTIKKISNNTEPVNILSKSDEVAIVSIFNGGTGYTVAPTVTIDAPTTGTRATATSTILGGIVTSITVTNGGSGYTAAPTVTIAPPPTGTTATATAIIYGGNVEFLTTYPLTAIGQAIKLHSSGSNWYSVP